MQTLLRGALIPLTAAKPRADGGLGFTPDDVKVRARFISFLFFFSSSPAL